MQMNTGIFMYSHDITIALVIERYIALRLNVLTFFSHQQISSGKGHLIVNPYTLMSNLISQL